jgi:hypothetical protein
MRRMPLLAWVFTVAIALFLLYRVKYEVQSLRTQVSDTARELEAEKEALHVVAAEWAYLNRPERLRSLAGKYLASTGVTVDQIAEIEAIPFDKQTQVSLATGPTLAHYKPDGDGE